MYRHSEGNGRLEKKGRFSLKNFSYDGRSQCLHLPRRRTAASDEGALGRNTSGRIEIRYASREAICRACPSEGTLPVPEGISTDHRVAGNTKTFSTVIARGCKAQPN